MIFTATPIAGVVVVDPSPISDDRGWFARIQCPDESAAAGFPFSPVQTSIARNTAAGTLRGLHWQAEPEAETKLVRVIRGRIFDVAVDIRRDSPTYCEWVGFELDAEMSRGLLLGPGIAHGYISLESQTDVLYQIAPTYRSGFERGARWDDPAFHIHWPMAPSIVSQRDSRFSLFLP